MPGPPPDPRSRRAQYRPGLRELPPDGRQGEPPAWPIGDEPPGQDVADLWARVWSTPQADAWEALGWTRVVARYVLVTLEAEECQSAAMLSEARQLEDRLGLSPMSMARLQWSIAAPPPAEVNEPTVLDDYRRRLEVQALYGEGRS